jgi:hypothetical protein
MPAPVAGLNPTFPVITVGPVFLISGVPAKTAKLTVVAIGTLTEKAANAGIGPVNPSTNKTAKIWAETL